MTEYYDYVYVNHVGTVCGPVEKEGPLSKYFDKTFSDYYMGEDSYELAEVKLVRASLRLLLNKAKLSNKDIDLVIGGDLLNQITASSYGCYGVGKSFIGVYGACSSSALGIIIGANFINSHVVDNCIGVVSSHNLAAEKQFRQPVEYGARKSPMSTFTSTGAAAILLSSKKSDIRVESSTLGRIIDYRQMDASNMGRVMAGAAADTIVKHLEDTGRDINYYDLVLTGDLGVYGKMMLTDYMKEVYSIKLDNYDDAGVMLYEVGKDSNIAGGSGPVCSALVLYSYIFYLMRKRKLKRVLFVATGALFSPCLVHQGEAINSISHAVSLEVV